MSDLQNITAPKESIAKILWHGAYIDGKLTVSQDAIDDSILYYIYETKASICTGHIVLPLQLATHEFSKAVNTLLHNKIALAIQQDRDAQLNGSTIRLH